MKFIIPLMLLSILCFSCNEEVSEGNPLTFSPSTDNEKVIPEEIIANSKSSLAINGMMCEIGCVRTIKSHLSKMNGVTKIQMDFDTARTVDYAIVEFDSNFIHVNEMKTEIEDIANGIYEVKSIEKIVFK